MIRRLLVTITPALLMTAASANAQAPMPPHVSKQAYAKPIQYAAAAHSHQENDNGAAERQNGAAAMVQGYPQMNAPLYPVPQPNIPVQVGGTVISNQAFAPHEMLYSHTYRAMYPPFYYKVKGGWIWTPFGIESHEKWELQGTVVKVKYRPRFGLFSSFVPPLVR